MEFQAMKTGEFLDGRPVIEQVSQEIFELVGSIKDWEPEWRSTNGAGGEYHYTYGNEKQYVSLLFLKMIGSDDISMYTLNCRFIYNLKISDFPNPLPNEWGKSGERFRFTPDNKLIYESELQRLN